MKLLNTPEKISEELTHLINECTRMQIAVAWATTNHSVCVALISNKDKIDKFVVGTHFFQTDPNFLEEFINNEKVRAIHETGEIFHPKIYYFKLKNDEWKCLIGSANFTKGAMEKNKEVMVCFSCDDRETQNTESEIWSIIDKYFQEGHIIKRDDIDNYKKHYDNKKKSRESLSINSFFNIPIFNYTWEEYYNEIINYERKKYNNLEEKIKVIKDIKILFKKKYKFKDLEEKERRKIAGYEPYYEENGMDWQFFGSTRASGAFTTLIKHNNENISLALEQIPFDGEIRKEHYKNFLEFFKKASSGKNLLAGATRLLCMKRPDYFLTLNGANKDNFCKAFEIKKSHINLDNYWDLVVSRIISCVWWNNDKIVNPKSEDEKTIWNARVAFLDSLYYERKNKEGQNP